VALPRALARARTMSARFASSSETDMFLPWDSYYCCNNIGFDRATQSIVIARSVSDEAIHSFFLTKWIASLRSQ
jgi:hypothetical protein